MKAPFTLIPDHISNDTVECLETLLRHARQGEIIGVAFVATLKQRAYIANAAGECHRNPTFTRGMLAALDDKLGAQVMNSL